MRDLVLPLGNQLHNRICTGQISTLNAQEHGSFPFPMHIWPTKGVLACESSLTPAKYHAVSMLVSSHALTGPLTLLAWSRTNSLERIGTTRIWDMLETGRPKPMLRLRSSLDEPTTRSR